MYANHLYNYILFSKILYVKIVEVCKIIYLMFYKLFIYLLNVSYITKYWLYVNMLL